MTEIVVAKMEVIKKNLDYGVKNGCSKEFAPGGKFYNKFMELVNEVISQIGSNEDSVTKAVREGDIDTLRSLIDAPENAVEVTEEEIKSVLPVETEEPSAEMSAEDLGFVEISESVESEEEETANESIDSEEAEEDDADEDIKKKIEKAKKGTPPKEPKKSDYVLKAAPNIDPDDVEGVIQYFKNEVTEYCQKDSSTAKLALINMCLPYIASLIRGVLVSEVDILLALSGGYKPKEYPKAGELRRNILKPWKSIANLVDYMWEQGTKVFALTDPEVAMMWVENYYSQDDEKKVKEDLEKAYKGALEKYKKEMKSYADKEAKEEAKKKAKEELEASEEYQKMDSSQKAKALKKAEENAVKALTAKPEKAKKKTEPEKKTEDKKEDDIPQLGISESDIGTMESMSEAEEDGQLSFV